MRRWRASVAANSVRSWWLVAVLFGTGWFSEVSHATEVRVREVRAIAVSVGDLDRMTKFYTDVLGFRVDPGEAGGQTLGQDRSQWIGVQRARVRSVALRLGQERVELCRFIRPKGRPMPADSRSTDHWFQHLALVVRDMDEAYAHLRRWNVAHVSTGPQTLPSWNTNAAGIRAFYFRDPEDHVLEVIWFPPGKGDPRWQVPGGELFRGIDHTAIVVSDTARSIAYYSGTLGLRVVGGSENWGVEQEHLNQVFGARVRITALRAPEVLGLSFSSICLRPGDGIDRQTRGFRIIFRGGSNWAPMGRCRPSRSQDSRPLRFENVWWSIRMVTCWRWCREHGMEREDLQNPTLLGTMNWDGKAGRLLRRRRCRGAALGGAIALPTNGVSTWSSVCRWIERHHGVEYGAEALGLGLFMVVACVVGLVLEHPDSWVRQQIGSALARRGLAGLAMGGALIGLVHSPWGRRSGAHLNPAVTLAFAWSGKVATRDVAGYILAQFLGGALGVGIVAAIAGPWLQHPAVRYVVTVPGDAGRWLALVAEAVISMLMMAVVLIVSRRPTSARFTSLAAAILLCLFITFESPWSGTSMNPARTVASALASGTWNGWWIYFVGPVGGMLAGVLVAAVFIETRTQGCAKLCHDARYRCIFCEHQGGEGGDESAGADPCLGVRSMALLRLRSRRDVPSSAPSKPRTMKEYRRLPVQDSLEMPATIVAGDSRYMAGTTPYAEDLTPVQRRLSLVCRCVAAGIMLETLWFKFTGHPESVWIFTKMGMESWWRYGQGIWELAASILLFVPRGLWLGCLLSLGAMSAAILSHFAVLGIAIQGDGGLLFGMACTAWLASFVATWLHQQSIPHITRLDD